MRVAIQGELGSFSHEAASQMLPDAAVVPCARSAEVFDRVENGKVQAAVIPIENSLAGSVAEHFRVWRSHLAFWERRLTAELHPVSADLEGQTDRPESQQEFDCIHFEEC